MESIDKVIASGNYDILLKALKGLRNGIVYGCKVRAPHTLVLQMVWSKGTYKDVFKRIYELTYQHATNLGKFAVVYKLLMAVLAKLSGCEQPWHSFVLGALCGSLFWGDSSPVNVQVNMYLLSRIISGFLWIAVEKSKTKLPSWAFRAYAGLMWACVMFLFYNHPTVLQASLRQSMTFIYRDSDSVANATDLVLNNATKTMMSPKTPFSPIS